MTNDDFEWDKVKAAANLAKHGVSFEQAREAFDDPFAIDFVDDREHHGEDRLILFGMVENRLLVVAHAERRQGADHLRTRSRATRATQNTMKRTAKKSAAKHDWSRLDAMTAAEKHAAALGDHDNRPLTEEDMTRMKRSPRAKIIRRALGLSQEDFAALYHIPIGTLRDWEQGRVEPDQAARAYLTVIARAPAAVRKALRSRSRPQP
jgi:putative transcriptional regulator